MTSDPNNPSNEPDATRITTPRNRPVPGASASAGASGGAGAGGHAGARQGHDAFDDTTVGIPALQFRTGQMILARYRLLKPLGRGGFGVVWRASDENLHIDVAIKFLAPEIVHNPEAIEDLKQETRYSLRLTHPNIVRIHGFFQEPELAGILMEYVDGGTLQALKIERPGRFFEAAEVGAWIPSLCDALDYAHAKAKVVHRDLKPGNIMLDSSGEVKIADFGISSSISDTHSRLSLTSGGKATSGTPVYMSPQHLMGTRPSVADDIYSFGATLFDLLAGKPPFYTGDIAEQVRLLPPPSIAQRRRELGFEGAPVPRAWEETIAACLAKNPGDRPASAGQVAAMLGFGRSATARGASTARDEDPLADQADLFATRPARSDAPRTGAPSEGGAGSASGATSGAASSGTARSGAASSGAASVEARTSDGDSVGARAESQAEPSRSSAAQRHTDRAAERTPRSGPQIVERAGSREVMRAAPRDVLAPERPRSRVANRVAIASCAVVVLAVAVLGAMKMFGGGEGGSDSDRVASTTNGSPGSAAPGSDAPTSMGAGATIGGASDPASETGSVTGSTPDAPPNPPADAQETASDAALDEARAANDARASKLRESIAARMRAQQWAAAARESEALLALVPNDREASQWLDIARSRARAEERAAQSRAGAAAGTSRDADASAGNARASTASPSTPSTSTTQSESPPPPPTPAQAQPPALEPSAEEGVRTTLARYESALESLNAAAYVALWQSMDPAERKKIERSFQQFSAQSVELAISGIEIDANRAMARFSEKRKLTPVVGPPLTPEPRNVSMKLERAADGAWRIISMN